MVTIDLKPQQHGRSSVFSSIKKLGAAVVALFISSASVSSFGDPQSSFYASFVRPLTIYVSNPPMHFDEVLSDITLWRDVFVPLSETQNSSSADVWVFFLKSRAEIDALPSGIINVLNSIGTDFEVENSASGYIEFALVTGEQKAAAFHLLYNYSPNLDPVVVLCRSAWTVLGSVIGMDGAALTEKLATDCT